MRHSLTILTATALGIIFVLTGCARNPFAEALPADRQVKIVMKGNADTGQALVDDETQYAALYDTTYDMTRGINGMVVGLLGITRWIVSNPPSEQPDEDHAVWGPSEPDGLERLQYKATAERLAEGEFKFELLARPKDSEDEADYGAIYTLNYTRVDVEVGHGTIEIDRDVHKAIDPMDPDICDSGKAVVTFSNDGEDSMKRVDIDFSELDRSGCDDNAQLGVYHYAEAEDGSGDFSFSAFGNIHEGAEAALKPETESLTIRSQWKPTGEGRTDVIVADGAVPADLTACGAPCEGLTEVVATQCWDSGFVSRFESTVPEVLQPHILPGVDAAGALNPVGDETLCPFDFADPTQNPNS